MIRVCNIIPVCNSGNHTKPLFQTLSKLVCGRFDWRAIQRIINILFLLPFVTLIVHVLHNIKRKRLSLWVCMALSGHCHDALIQTGITKRNSGISTKEQLINLLALFQTSKTTMLPMNRRSIGYCPH